MPPEGFRVLRELIGLGALLHDVGKLKTRLEDSQKGKNWIENLLKEFEFEVDLKNQLKDICKNYKLLEDCEKIDPLEVILSTFYLY